MVALGLSGAEGFLLAALQALPAGASIGGQVKDGETGTPLAGAAVSLPDIGRVVSTDNEGRYVIAGVAAGPQHVLVRRIGYAARRFHALVPSQGRLEIVVALHALPVSLQPIEVRAGIPPPTRGLEPEDSTGFPDRALSLAAVRNHPQLAEPDALQALGGGQVAIAPESPNGLHIRGGASDQTAYILDDIPILAPHHTGVSFTAWNPDALSRLRLTSLVAPEFPHMLSGVVAATTRSPGSEFLTQGGASTTQARMTLRGPLGHGGAGYLLSGRTAFPGLFGRHRDQTYLRGGSQDWLAKLEAPLLGGQVRVVGYGNWNDLAAAADTLGNGRNEFNWSGWSVGSAWAGQVGNAGFKLVAWTASQGAGALWSASTSVPDRLGAGRRDVGIGSRVSWSGPTSTTTAGIRVERISTRYDLGAQGDSLGSFTLRRANPVWAAFGEHTRKIAPRTEAHLGLVGAIARSTVYVSPALLLRVRPTAALTLQGGLSRRHQFVQSLRNPESMVASIFPTELFMVAGDELPVARSDLVHVALEYRPRMGLHLGAEIYARSFRGLALVQDAGPFVTSRIGTGRGNAQGLMLEAAANGARYAFLASYALQRVRYQFGDTSYIPAHAAGHALESGITVFPSPSWSLRLGITALAGRHTTAIAGGFEWESCNLLDWGCQFAGTPLRSGPIGATSVPAYVRVDLGVRKHWHWSLAGRDGELGVYATMTNILGRSNILTFVVDPATGSRTPVTMRPWSPLVAGMDWRF
ncbi:MAG: carboxypeptidase regulatory-like domain-containing protein [Gemmatimonadales bacterium]